MFHIGEQIVYPVHGAGVVEAIEEKEILGEYRKYYSLRLNTGGLQVLVPVDKAEDSGLRQICGQDELEKVRKVLSSTEPNWEENWNHRYRLHMDKIKSGDICQLAEVVRNLFHREKSKGLSAGEKKMLDNARDILLSEVQVAAGISTEEAKQRLLCCLTPHA